MHKIFKSNNPINGIILLLFGFAFKMPFLLKPQVPLLQSTDGFFYRYFINFLVNKFGASSIIFPLFAFLLLYIQSLILNSIVNRLNLLNKNSYLAAYCYFFLTSLIAEWNVISAPLVVNTIIIGIWSFLQGDSYAQNFKSNVFSSAFILSLASTLYFPSILFLIVVIILLLQSGKFNLRSALIFIFGFATPYYLIISWFYITNSYIKIQSLNVALTLPLLKYYNWQIISLVFMAFISILTFVFLNTKIARKTIQQRKRWSIIYLYFILSLVIPFVNASNDFAYWILVAVPISIFSALFLEAETKNQWHIWIFNALQIFAVAYWIKIIIV